MTPDVQLGEGRRLPAVSKIAILRATALGDFVFGLPAYEAVRMAYPDAEIVLLAKEWAAGFADERPGAIDRVEIVPRSPGVNGEETAEPDTEALAEFFSRMRAERFDLALQLHGGGRYSNPFVQRLGARHTAGLRATDAPPLERWLRYVYRQSEVLRWLEAVSLVGASNPEFDPFLAVTEADRVEAREVLATAGLVDRRSGYVVLHPGANDPRRRWSADRFGRLGKLIGDLGLSVAITGVASERAVVSAVMDTLGVSETSVFDLCGRLSLGGLTGVLAGAACVVANDTGPLHLAGAVGAPTVGIYWAGNLVNMGPVTRKHRRSVTSWQMSCPVCGRHSIEDPCDHLVSFVDRVEPEQVFEQVLDLVESRGVIDSRPSWFSSPPTIYWG